MLKYNMLLNVIGYSIVGCIVYILKKGGCSSVVERHVANVNVVGSKPITRSIIPLRDKNGEDCSRL